MILQELQWWCFSYQHSLTTKNTQPEGVYEWNVINRIVIAGAEDSSQAVEFSYNQWKDTVPSIPIVLYTIVLHLIV